MKFRSPRLSKHRGRARCANKKGIANAKARGVYKGGKATCSSVQSNQRLYVSPSGYQDLEVQEFFPQIIIFCLPGLGIGRMLHL